MYFMWVPPASEPDGSDGQAVAEQRVVLDPAGDPDALRRAVGFLTFDQLVCAWRSSEIALAKADDVRRRSQLVMLRGMVLDEVETRRPRLYRRWLRDGGPHRR
jgi:bifunctional DNA-binding transcriptional regulator/antitoxin component of YhaV-PrlF toxin-antitoxin module